MTDETYTVPLESKLVAIALAARMIDEWMRRHGKKTCESMCRRVVADPHMPEEYRKAFATAFGR